MAVTNRVVWSDGLFIKPQHFQQQQRYLEHQINERSLAVSDYLYGFSDLELNAEYLSFGRVGLVRASGLFPDGTRFNLPQDDVMPEPLEIADASVANQVVYLALPLGSDSLAEVEWPDTSIAGRFRAQSEEIRDLHSIDGDAHTIDVARVAPRLMLERDDRSAYAALAIGRILEKRPDGSLVMDPNFMPTMLSVRSAPRLQRFVGEMAGLMRERARNIAERVGAPGQGGVADVADFMLLQMLNRAHPRFMHLARLRQLHPERLYEALLELCGELVTFTDEGRLPREYLAYDHDLPEDCFHTFDAGLAAISQHGTGAPRIGYSTAAAPVRSDRRTGARRPADSGRRIYSGGQGRHAAGRSAQAVHPAVQSGLGRKDPRSHQPATAGYSAVGSARGSAPVAVSCRVCVLPAGRSKPGLANARQRQRFCLSRSG